MTVFYLVRHGQTAWNQAKLMQGRQDSPLTDLGLRQAQDAGVALEPVRFDAAYVSPTGRARNTIAIILQHLNAFRQKHDTGMILQPQIHEGLAELGLGAWEGASYADDREGNNPDRQRYHFWYEPDKFDASTIGAEDFQTVTARVLNALEEIANRVGSGTVLVVSHTIAIRSALNHFLGIPISGFWQEPSIRPCGLSILHWQNRREAEVITYGDKVFNSAKL